MQGCNSQSNPGKEKTDIEEIKSKPHKNVVVNKEYDEEGNLVRYDSTYSYYYSNIEDDSLTADSIMKNFRENFNKTYSFSNDPFFENLFFEDTLLNFDFYTKDFFGNRFSNNMDRMSKLFQQMDSLKNSFFMKQFPDEKTKP